MNFQIFGGEDNYQNQQQDQFQLQAPRRPGQRPRQRTPRRPVRRRRPYRQRPQSPSRQRSPENIPTNEGLSEWLSIKCFFWCQYRNAEFEKNFWDLLAFSWSLNVSDMFIVFFLIKLFLFTSALLRQWNCFLMWMKLICAKNVVILFYWESTKVLSKSKLYQWHEPIHLVFHQFQYRQFWCWCGQNLIQDSSSKTSFLQLLILHQELLTKVVNKHRHVIQSYFYLIKD